MKSQAPRSRDILHSYANVFNVQSNHVVSNLPKSIAEEVGKWHGAL